MPCFGAQVTETTYVQPLRESLTLSLGAYLGSDLLPQAQYLSRLYAGNETTLRVGVVVGPYVPAPKAEWVGVRICAAQPAWRFNELGATIVFDIMSGAAAGCRFDQFVPAKHLYRLICDLRVSKQQRGVAYPSVLVNARLFIDLRCRDGRMRARQFEATPATKHFNSALAHTRVYKNCLRGITTHCCECHVGTEQCGLGTHAQTLRTGYCTRCKRDGYILPGQICLGCSVQGWYKQAPKRV